MIILNSKYLKLQRHAFSLIELLVILAIISVLAALLFPVFGTVRGRARQISCASNLRQIGLAFSAYTQDYGGQFPRCIDTRDPKYTAIWQVINPRFAIEIPHLSLMKDALQPYSQSKELFHCPGDVGFVYSDFSHTRVDALPSSYEKYGNSYFYRTGLVVYQVHEVQLPEPSRINVLCDLVGFWHGTLTPLEDRFNVLFADWHVKSLNRDQLEEVRDQKIPGAPEPTFVLE